jgi:hypothetical protein
MTDHQWVGPRGLIRYVHCRVCLMIKNLGKPNKPCKGAGRLRPMEKPFESSQSDRGDMENGLYALDVAFRHNAEILDSAPCMPRRHHSCLTPHQLRDNYKV